MAEFEPHSLGESRALALFVAAAVALAGVGFLTGTARVPQPIPPLTKSSAEPKAQSRAIAYAELRDMRRGPNAGLYEGAVAALNIKTTQVEPITPSELERAEAVHTRAQRRAYDGAPPTIPHTIDQLGLPSCLGCHQGGMQLSKKRAPAISHPPYQNCVQCHVVSTAPSPLPSAETTDNQFAPEDFRRHGQRAWTSAPPTVPHSTLMRETCTSCHGESGATGLRTSHPERANCLQCHALSAHLNHWAVEESPQP